MLGMVGFFLLLLIAVAIIIGAGALFGITLVVAIYVRQKVRERREGLYK